MPRPTKVFAVPVTQESSDSLARATDENSEAEQMTDIIHEVREEPKEELEQILSDVLKVLVVAKGKAKLASRAKPKEEPKEEPKAEPKEEPKVLNPRAPESFSPVLHAALMDLVRPEWWTLAPK